MSGELRAVLWLCFWQCINTVIYVVDAYFFEKDKEKAKNLAKSLGLFTIGVIVSAFVCFIGCLG